MAEAPPHYQQVSDQTFKDNQVVVPPGTVPVAIPGGPVAAYPTVHQSVPAYMQPRVVYTIPAAFMPNDYLIVTIVIVIICAILNITSLGFSMPALICSLLAIIRRQDGQYLSAKKFGYGAIILDIICVMWTLLWALFLVSLILGLHFVRRRY